jgi:predicted 2-oxoglutarate/Fe(II)-dependent dioxygenase YbiX
MEYFEEFLTKDECEYLIHLIDNSIPIFNVESNREIDVFHMNQIPTFLENKLKEVSIINVSSFNINRYGIGSYFEKHVDVGGKNDPNGKRLKTLIINLSDEESYTGGDLIVDGKIVNKKIGGCVLFSSKTEHSLSKVLSGIRYSVVIWLGKEHIDGLITLI